MRKNAFILPPDIKRKIAKIEAKLQALIKGPSIQIAEGVVVPKLRVTETDIRFAKPTNYNRQVMKPLYRRDLTGVPSVEFIFADKVLIHALEEGIDLRLDGVGFRLVMTLEDEPRMFAGFGKKPYIAIADVEELKGRVRQLFARILAKNYKLAEEILSDEPDRAATFMQRVVSDPDLEASEGASLGAEDGEDVSVVEDAASGLDPAVQAFMEKTIGRSYVLTTDSQPPLRVKIVSLIGTVLTVEALQDFTAKKAGKTGDRYKIDLSAAPAGTAPEKVFEAALHAAMKALYQVHGRTKIRGIAMDSGVNQSGRAEEDVEIDLPAFPTPKVEPVVEAPPAPVQPLPPAPAPVEAPPAPKVLKAPNRFDMAFLKRIEKDRRYGSSFRKEFNEAIGDSFFSTLRDRYDLKDDHLVITLTPDQVSMTVDDFKITLEVYKAGADLVVHISDGTARKTFTQNVGDSKETSVIQWGEIGKLAATLPTVVQAYRKVTTAEMFQILSNVLGKIVSSDVGVKISNQRDDLPATPTLDYNKQISGNTYKAEVRAEIFKRNRRTLPMTFEYDESEATLYITMMTFDRFEFYAKTAKYSQEWLEKNLYAGIIQHFVADFPIQEMDEETEQIAKMDFDSLVGRISNNLWRELDVQVRLMGVKWQMKAYPDATVVLNLESDPPLPGLQIYMVFNSDGTARTSAGWEAETSFLIRSFTVKNPLDRYSPSWLELGDLLSEKIKPRLYQQMPATQWKGYFSEFGIVDDEIVEEAFWSVVQRQFREVAKSSRVFNIQKMPSRWIITANPSMYPFELESGKKLAMTKTTMEYTMSADSGFRPQSVRLNSGMSGSNFVVQNPSSETMAFVDALEKMLREDFANNLYIMEATETPADTKKTEMQSRYIIEAIRPVLGSNYRVDLRKGLVTFITSDLRGDYREDVEKALRKYVLTDIAFNIENGMYVFDLNSPAKKTNAVDPNPVINAVLRAIGGSHLVDDINERIIFTPDDRTPLDYFNGSREEYMERYVRPLEEEVRGIVTGLGHKGFDVYVDEGSGKVFVEFGYPFVKTASRTARLLRKALRR